MSRLPLVALLLVAAGCQGKPQLTFARVEGTITRDGKPVSGVLVVFWPDVPTGTPCPHSSGATDAEGHYDLHTDQGQEGAVPGHYRVCVAEPAVLFGRLASRKSASDRVPKDLSTPAAGLPLAYADRSETPLRAEVQPGVQVIDLEVK